MTLGNGSVSLLYLLPSLEIPYFTKVFLFLFLNFFGMHNQIKNNKAVLLMSAKFHKEPDKLQGYIIESLFFNQYFEGCFLETLWQIKSCLLFREGRQICFKRMIVIKIIFSSCKSLTGLIRPSHSRHLLQKALHIL